MDRGRFWNRASDLRTSAALVGKLAQIPDRASQKDFQQAADLMAKAASDIEELLDAQLPGCTCRLVETDNYSYVDYDESCRHHGQIYRQHKELKSRYAKLEEKLKDEVRLKLVAAAISGASPGASVLVVVERALAIADEAIRQISGRK